MLSWNDFEKVDLRVGTIIEVNDFPEAKKPAFQMKIDFGELGVKKTSAQVTVLYTKEQLLGRQVMAVTNFPPKQIASYFSECLVLGVIGANKEIILLQPDRPVPNGLRIG